MFTSLKKFSFVSAVVAVVAMSVSSADAADPGLRLYLKQHPGRTSRPVARQTTSSPLPQVFRSFSFEPSATAPAVDSTQPYPNCGCTTTRSFSFEPGNDVPQMFAPSSVRSGRQRTTHIERKMHVGLGLWK
tara:strand:- start:19507 stop:19899 length:393 start_codon:yes stop_codon:yes gene_type:complete